MYQNGTHHLLTTYVPPAYLRERHSPLAFYLRTTRFFTGLNWLIKLHENGINGILADEVTHLLNLPTCYVPRTTYD